MYPPSPLVLDLEFWAPGFRACSEIFPLLAPGRLYIYTHTILIIYSSV